MIKAADSRLRDSQYCSMTHATSISRSFINRFLCFDFAASLRGWESTDAGDGKETSRAAENRAKNKNRSNSGTGRWNFDFKVSISVKIQFPSDFVKHKSTKSKWFGFWRFLGRFFEISRPGGGAGRGVNFCDFELSRTILNQKYQNFSKGIKFYLSWHQQAVHWCYLSLLYNHCRFLT